MNRADPARNIKEEVYVLLSINILMPDMIVIYFAHVGAVATVPTSHASSKHRFAGSRVRGGQRYSAKHPKPYLTADRGDNVVESVWNEANALASGDLEAPKEILAEELSSGEFLLRSSASSVPSSE